VIVKNDDTSCDVGTFFLHRLIPKALLTELFVYISILQQSTLPGVITTLIRTHHISCIIVLGLVHCEKRGVFLIGMEFPRKRRATMPYEGTWIPILCTHTRCTMCVRVCYAPVPDNFVSVPDLRVGSDTKTHLSMASKYGNIHCKECARGIMICKGCETIYSTSHFQQHRQQLAQQLDKIVHQHNLLQELLYPTSSSSMQENNIKQSDLLKIIEQWKYETIKRIEDAAELAQQQVTQLMNETTDKVKKDFRLVANEITHSQSEDNYVEQDLDSWTEQLNKLKQQLLTTTQTIELNIIPNNEIDWSSMIKIKKFSFNSLKIMKPSRIVNIVHGFGGIQLGASAKSFVHYAISQNALNQYNQNGHEKTIGWNFGRINDICYSHDLNQYVMITSNSVYAYNENNNRIEKKPIRSGSAPYMQYWSCTTTPQMLLISYDHWGSRIEQFEMSNYKMIKYWN
ncbi:unnamed protein product, partial [Didymodactylos carnosus]